MNEPASNHSQGSNGSRKSSFLKYVDAAKEIFCDAAESTSELAHDMKETVVGHTRNDIDKKVDKAVENFEDLKEQLAEEQEELRDIQRQEVVAENKQNLHQQDELKRKETNLKRQELETEAQVAEAAGEYKRLRTEQLREKKEHEQTVQHVHPNDPKALIDEM